MTNDSKIVLIQFNTKSLRVEKDDDSDDIPYYEPDEDGEINEDPIPYIPTKKVYNQSTFLNEWFYNGIYAQLTISSKFLYSYLTLENSKLLVDKCVEEKIGTKIYSNGNLYTPVNSSSFKKNSKGGSDEFSFIVDMKFENKTMDNLDFIFDEDLMKEEILCGSVGLNLNSGENTNLVEQLKKKSEIEKNIWSFIYQTEENGIIVLGKEPHDFDKSFYKSQYRKVYAKPVNDGSKTSWNLEFTGTYLNYKEKKDLKDTKAELHIDRGLIVGTEEYKKLIDELFFNKLIEEKICFRELVKFDGNNKEYFVYYCKTYDFIGKQGEYSIIEDKQYFHFPELVFYFNEYNKTFVLDKHKLFQSKPNTYTYFLIIFENEKRDIWQLGEPFFYKDKLVFDQDNKMLGFYVSTLNITDDNVSEGNSKSHVLIIVGIIILSVGLIALAYFLGKKINEKRKQRANELKDDDFDYQNKENNILYKN